MYTNVVTRREKKAISDGFISNVRKIFKIKHIQSAIITLKGGLPHIVSNAVSPIDFFMNVNKYSKYIGTTFFRTGSIPIKFRHLNLNFVSFVKDNYDRINKRITDYIVDELLNFRIVVEGSYLSNQNSFKNMSKGNERTNKFKAEEILDDLDKAEFYGLNMFLIDIDIDSSLLKYVQMNKESFPGIMTSNYFGNTRKETMQSTLVCAERLFDFIGKHSVKYCGLYKVLGREKDVKCTEDSVIKGTRPILAPEEMLTLIAGLFSQLITISIRQDKENNLFIGKTLSKNSYRSFYDKCPNYYYMLSSDWQNFDQYVDEESILAACSIFRSLFPSDKKYDRYFYFIATSLIHKNIVFPPGVIYECTNGIPSGHPFTSILGSLINYIHWTRILYYSYGNIRNDKGEPNWISQYMGDDSRHLLKKAPVLEYLLRSNIDNLSSLQMDEKDFSLNPVISTIHDYNDKFLKRCLSYDQLVYWDRRSIIRKLIYPSKPKTQYHDLRSWILNWVDTAPGDIILNNFLGQYLDYISFLLDRRIYSGEMSLLVKGLSSRLLAKVTSRSFQRIYSDMKVSLEDRSDVSRMHQAFSIPLIKHHIISEDVQAILFTTIMDGRQYLKYRNVLEMVSKRNQEFLTYKMPNAPNTGEGSCL